MTTGKLKKIYIYFRQKYFGGNKMMNCFGFGDNCCLYILIILLILCLCGNGCLTGIFDKICSCGCLPLILVLLCCCKDKFKPFMNGCGCK
ncbi:MAG TPA: chorion class high-cysteine HCB protein 13 [Clostridiales bacterium]|nr:chorion class high-cysteine HCB protein 13 [Clostridiales bacterium]HBJ98280.1 chorion class high-cysteine HCB protein 13 [Clostridiales bacterium]